jgi:DNA-binding response OmpR family regulator
MRHAGECCDREQILEEVWNLDFDPSTNLVSVQICEIRAALEPHGYRSLVQTVRGRGYRLRRPGE